MADLSKLTAKLKASDLTEVFGNEGNWHNNRIAKGGPQLEFGVGAKLTLRAPDSHADVARAAKDLVRAIDWAAKNGWTLRAAGSRWSFADVMAPGRKLHSQQSILVDTSLFQLRYQVGDFPRQIYVTCGANLHNVNRELEKIELCIRTSGSSDGQTVAGAIGTGVHGSAYKIGAIHDTVAGIHLATKGGHMLVYRDDARLPEKLRNKIAGQFDIRDVRLDPDLFDALCVSFGSFGVIIGFVMDVDPLYALRVVRQSFPSSQLGKLIEILKNNRDLGTLHKNFKEEPGDDHHHCQIMINPYDDQNYRIMVMIARTGMKPDAPFVWPDEFSDFQIGLAVALSPLMDMADFMFEGQVTGEFNKLQDINQWGYRSEIFGSPNQQLAVHSLGVGVPIDRVQEALWIVHATVKVEKFPGASELRFVPPSNAHLAINRFAPLTAVIGFDGLDKDDSWEFSREFLKRLKASDIPFAFHWGKMNDLNGGSEENARRLKRIYGPSLDKWKTARSRLLGDYARVFDNEFIRRLGLDLHP